MKIARRMKKLLCGILALILLSSPVSAVSSNDALTVTQGCSTIDAQMPMHSSDERMVQTYSSLLYDITNDSLIYADNPDGQYAPSGLVKIMTGLIIAEQGNMADQVTVKQEVLDGLPERYRGMDLQVGEVIPLQDLLYATMVLGANAAAYIAADHIAGSQEAFVQMMNDRAAELGCTGTNYVNVHGLDDDLQVTTARDMAKIVAAAIENEVFEDAFGTYVIRIPATNMSEERKISSENYLFNQNLGSNHFDARATGSRMGLIGNNDYNLVVTAENDGVELISIVLGSSSVINPNGEEGCYKEARVLLDMGFIEHKHVNVFHERQILKQYKVINGECDVTAYVNVNAAASLPAAAADADLTYRFSVDENQIKAPVYKDSKLGSVEVWYQNFCLAEAELFAMHDVAVKETSSIEEVVAENESGSFTVLIVVGAIVGLLMILLFGRPIIFRIIRRNKINRRRKNQRRSH